ncbi:hypothetical protein HMPREF1981_02747 [Bacteroides pyogenes F0041]|uniref:Uncharacterized protein n=1 Tax=Bacteroides pyogenes F0041 TaxID=1321819 RepID=U2DQI4_9BACE|nr:hypothetical protein HMPREF1981_02747 [Bacteroides pyogenes F0041]
MTRSACIIKALSYHTETVNFLMRRRIVHLLRNNFFNSLDNQSISPIFAGYKRCKIMKHLF